jgi:MFS family permease
VSADVKIAAGLFLLAAVTFGYFTGGAGWNQDAHFDLTRAIVERQTLYIDGYDVNTGDVSKGTGGHTYINKPPGASILAAAPYALIFAIERGLHAPVDSLTRMNRWIATALSVGLCGALIGPILYRYGRRRMAATPTAALCVSGIILFGTVVLPYSTMLFAHIPAALFLLLAVTLVETRPLAAGVAAGIALTCFYVCALAAAILAVIAFCYDRRVAARFIAGAAPFAALMASYQWLCFGSPFRTSMEASTQFTQKGLLFGVIRMPSVDALYGITFSPYRGLFFVSPVLLLALAGLFTMKSKRELWAVTAIVIVFILTIASFNGWNGGYAFGPRYLVPIIPLLGIPMMAARPRVWWIVPAIVSIGLSFIATATDPMPSPEVQHPVSRYLVPAFFTGHIGERTRREIGWFETQSVANVAVARESGNVGEFIFGKQSRASVLPIVLWLCGGFAILLRMSLRQPQRLPVE